MPPSRVRHRPVGRTSRPPPQRGPSLGFKIAIGAIFGGILVVAFIPFLMIPTIVEEPMPAPTEHPRVRFEEATPTPSPRTEPVGEREPRAGNAAPPRGSGRRDRRARSDVAVRPPTEQTTPTHELLEDAEHALRQRWYDGAERFLDQAERQGAPRGDIASYRAMLHSGRGERTKAAAQAREAIRIASEIDLAEMHHIVGQAYYFAQELPRAIEEYETALEYRNDPKIRASLSKAVREARTADGFKGQRVSHFIVSYQGETMESVGRMAIDTLERSYSSLVSDFGFEPSEPVVVILYTRQSYRDMGRPHWSAGTFDGKIHIPVKGISWSDASVRGTLHHELAHAFIRSHVGRNVPRWLNEGIAEYVEGIRTRTVSARLKPHVDAGRSLGTCLLSQGCDVTVFYAASASMVDYLMELRGMGGLRDVLNGLAKGSSIDTCLQRTYGKNPSSLLRDWEGFLRRRV